MSRRHATIPATFPSLYRRLEEIILGNSGEDEFEEIIKLLVLKYWTENRGERFEDLNYEKGNKKLSQINDAWPRVLNKCSLSITETQFEKCKQALNDLRVFDNDLESVDAVFEFVVNKKKKGDKGQFFTPRNVVDFCIEAINIGNAKSIIDPASGSGAFLYRASKGRPDGCSLWAFDFDETAIRVARLLQYAGRIQDYSICNVNSLRRTNCEDASLELSGGGSIATIEDYLRMLDGPSKFEVLLTNPPFAGEVNDPAISNRYELAQLKPKAERDVLFIERALSLLQEDGRMAIILPDNVFGRKSNAPIREWILQNARIVGVIGLPRETFMPHTSVKTSILFLQKRKHRRPEDEEIFFAISEKIGKDRKGNILYKGASNDRIVDDDLGEISKRFKHFRQAKGIEW